MESIPWSGGTAKPLVQICLVIYAGTEFHVRIKAAIITSKLEGIAKLLAAAGGVAVAAQKLLPMAQQALEWARPLFR